MNGYHDRGLDDPHQPEDRAVAGWPGQSPDEKTGEATDDTPREGEPIVGEVWNEESAGEHDTGAGTGWGEHGRHEREGEGEAGETGLAEGETAEETDRGEHVGEPFGSEEPMIVNEPAEEAAPAAEEAEPVAAAEPHEGVEPVAVAEPFAEPGGTDTLTEPATEPEPAAEPVVEGARPTAADELSVENLLDQEAVDRLRDRWREVKGTFVDDPADAVRQASTLSGEAVDELTAALGRLRQNLDGHWDEGKETDTERLRVALRGYGSLIDRILTR